MKKVLITGANSYVGTNVEKWLMKEPDKYYVETLDMKEPNWKEFNFSKFDVVFHVAGIAHVSTKKNMRDLYFKVNRDLVIENALKAKESGVKKFIFMSIMIVYNSNETRITSETKPDSGNFYGLSKLHAEQGILPLQSDDFKVCILRPPMIYGPNSKGNYPRLSKISKKSFIFPDYPNIRSFLYIDNLVEFVIILILENHYGIFFPRNAVNISTTQLVKEIQIANNKKAVYTRIFNFIIRILTKLCLVKKVFGNSYYSDLFFVIKPDRYNITSFKDSIMLTEMNNE
jgi:nucleoside-diphosphate-sugar epimerase